MLKVKNATMTCFLVLTFACTRGSSIQATNPDHILTLPADKDYIVRFFYQPENNNYFHAALVFRVVDKKDPRWNTAPVFDVGRTAYISLPEMQQLVRELSRPQLSWDHATKVEKLETYKTIHSFGGMSIKVLSLKGSSQATIKPEKICEILAPLDAILQTPRALWEFQFFQSQYQCRVPNFDPRAYPDRIP